MESTAICSGVWVSLPLPLVHSSHLLTHNHWAYASLYLNSLPGKSMRHSVLPQCKITPLFVRKLTLQIFVLGNYYAEGFRRMIYWLVSVTRFSSFPLPFPGLQGASVSRFFTPSRVQIPTVFGGWDGENATAEFLVSCTSLPPP